MSADFADRKPEIDATDALAKVLWEFDGYTYEPSDPQRYRQTATELLASGLIGHTIRSVHSWGFFDGNGSPRRPDGTAPSALSPFDHWQRLKCHFDHFDTEINGGATHRTLDGWFLGIEFETEARDGAAAMWHTVMQPKDMWPDFPATDPSNRPVAGEQS